jgi:phage-related minor tail protein
MSGGAVRILNLSNGQYFILDLQNGILGNPESQAAAAALMRKWVAEDQDAVRVMNSYDFKKSLGLLSQKEMDAGQAAYEDDERRAREAGAEFNARAKAERDRQSAEYQTQSRLIATREAAAKKEADSQTPGLFSILSLLPIVPRGLFSPQAGN